MNPSTVLERARDFHFMRKRDIRADVTSEPEVRALINQGLGDGSTPADRMGAASSIGAILAGSDGASHAAYQWAIRCAHDAVGIHPARWEIANIDRRQAFDKAIEIARQTESLPGVIGGSAEPCNNWFSEGRDEEAQEPDEG